MAMDKESVKMDPARPQHLSLAFRDLQEIPEEINTKYSGTVTELDLSHNRLPDLRSLHGFQGLTTLILDNNELKSNVRFPPMPNLEMLWLNHNRITNLAVLVETVAKSFPKLKYFSLMNNEAAPSYFNGGSYQQYQDYRYYLLSHLPDLVTIDDITVTFEERQEATRIYGKRRIPGERKKKSKRKPKSLDNNRGHRSDKELDNVS